jgi:sucrose-6-phosphate hydrolase SacC (GH32 family)
MRWTPYWDVQDLNGKRAHLEIVHAATGGWGHSNVDQITHTDEKASLTVPLRTDVSRTLSLDASFLNLPIKIGGPRRRVTFRTDGTVIDRFEASLADAKPDWWAFVDVTAHKGKSLTITVDTLPEDSRALETVTNTDAVVGQETLYREPLRPQFHFSAKRGWLKDPNGLAYYNGEYYLFFQHCPFQWGGDGPKYWGLAVSRDLVHWKEVEEALAPDELSAMWSGSGVVDTNNTSGFGVDGKPPLVLIYTAAGDPFVQCIAYSTDGRRFTKYTGNPVVGNVTAGNRDPRAFWHEPTKRWVQALYVEEDRKHTVHLFTSPNLRDWTRASVVPGLPGTSHLYECPDFFPLALDGDTTKTKWIITGADSQYQVGSFDGTTFTPETDALSGHQGRGFYAAQTFNEEPKGRRIQIGWWQTETQGMPFNQSMSLPLELNLISTPDGPRMTWTPVEELESLRAVSHALGEISIDENSPESLAEIRSELMEVRAAFTPGDAEEVTFTVRGITVVFDVRTQEIIVNGHRAPASLHNGKQNVTIYVDRVGLEVFTSNGLTFVPMPVQPKPEDTGISVSARGGTVAFDNLDVYELKSAWQ